MDSCESYQLVSSLKWLLYVSNCEEDVVILLVHIDLHSESK